MTVGVLGCARTARTEPACANVCTTVPSLISTSAATLSERPRSKRVLSALKERLSTSAGCANFPVSLPSAGFQRTTSLPSERRKESVTAQCECSNWRRADRYPSRSCSGSRDPRRAKLVRPAVMTCRSSDERSSRVTLPVCADDRLGRFSMGTLGSIGRFQPDHAVSTCGKENGLRDESTANAARVSFELGLTFLTSPQNQRAVAATGRNHAAIGRATASIAAFAPTSVPEA